MNDHRWAEVDRYFAEQLLPDDAALDAALKSSAAAGLPAIQVSPVQGRMLHLLARMMGARRILEIGTLGAYSTIWLGRALPADGHLVTLESDEKHARVARGNIARAGLAGVVDLRFGRALDTLPALAAEDAEPFDLAFIDADKPSLPDYFAWALRLVRDGGLVVVDNVVREGSVIDGSSGDASVVGVRRMLELVASERRVHATAIQTVGSKGYDGFLIALLAESPPATR
jgi:predicted O-methyltransferase YrrM